MKTNESVYAAVPRRSLASAITYLLENEYALLGSHRVAEMIASDIVALVNDFYPLAERVPPGSLVWRTTKDEGKKAVVGKLTEAYPSVTVILPLITTEDVEEKMAGTRAEAHTREGKRVVRVVKSASEQGGLLTQAELGVMLNRSREVMGKHVLEHYNTTGEVLPLRGQRMDQGCSPTHKVQVVRLYESGMEAPDIARTTGHSLKSVERYLVDYKRVLRLVRERMPVPTISQIVGRGPTVVKQYVTLAHEYYPELHSTSG